MHIRGLTHCGTCHEPYVNGFECACTRKAKQEREEKLSMLLDLSKDEIEALINVAKRENERFKESIIKINRDKKVQEAFDNCYKEIKEILGNVEGE